MKTRTTHRKQRKYKKNKLRRTLRRHKKRGGQVQMYSIPGTKPVYTTKEYIPEESEEEEQPLEQESIEEQQGTEQESQQQQYDFAADAGDKITGALNQLKDVFNQAAQQVKDTYSNAKNKALEHLGKAAQKAQVAAQTASEQIKHIQTASPQLVVQNPSGGRRRKMTRRYRTHNKTKKFPRHKNLQFYV